MNSLQGLQLHQLYLIALVLIYIVYKQIATRPVKGSRYVIIPLVLIYFTLDSIDSISEGLWNVQGALITLLCVGIITGLISGFITQIFRGEDGILYQKGGWPAFLFLIITIPIRFILRYYIGHIPGNEIINQAGLSYLIMISSQMLIKSLVVFLRCPEVWKLFLDERVNKRERRRGRKEAKRKLEN